ncbi:hypothetical protein D3C81_07480 [compost metagenome]
MAIVDKSERRDELIRYATVVVDNLDLGYSFLNDRIRLANNFIEYINKNPSYVDSGRAKVTASGFDKYLDDLVNGRLV